MPDRIPEAQTQITGTCKLLICFVFAEIEGKGIFSDPGTAPPANYPLLRTSIITAQSASNCL